MTYSRFISLPKTQKNHQCEQNITIVQFSIQSCLIFYIEQFEPLMSRRIVDFVIEVMDSNSKR